MLVFAMDVCCFPLSCSNSVKLKCMSWRAPELRATPSPPLSLEWLPVHSRCRLMQSTPVEVLAEGLFLFWLLLRVTLPWDDSMESRLKNNMDKRHCLYLKSSLPFGFAPFFQNQAFMSSFSPMKFFIETLQFTYVSLPTPSPPNY